MDTIELIGATVTVAASVGGTYALMQYKIEQLKVEFSKLEGTMDRKMDLKDFEAHKEHQKDKCRETHDHVNRDRTELLQAMEKLSAQIESLKVAVMSRIPS